MQGSEQETQDIFQALEDVSPLRRSKALEELRVSVKENQGHLLFGNVKRVFSVLKARLRDSNWNVAHQTVQFLGELFRMSDLGPDCKSCLSIILPTLVESIGDTKPPIRKSSLQVLKDLLVHTDSVGLVVETFLRSGLENEDERVREYSVQALPSIVECARNAAGMVDTPSVVDALVSRLRDPSMVVVQAAEESIFALQAQMGEDAVQAAVKRMGQQKQALFAEHQKNIMKNSGSNFMITPAADTLLQFGFVPINALNQLRDAGNYKIRLSGIEELDRLVSGLTNVSPVVPHLPALMDFLAGLLTDQNFKISLTSIHILGAMVEKFGASLEPALANIFPPLVDKLGDNKIVVRQGIMKFMNGLISFVNPDPVLKTLLGYCDGKSARVREEVMNIVTIALLKASDHPFDFPALVQPLCRALTDSKPKVRDAAMDAMAVMHSRIGTSEMNAILTPALVDEETFRRLQDQFAQGMLPKLSAEGLVLHVAQGGGSGLTIDSGGGEDLARSRRTTPASRSSVTPGTTPSAQKKIPWDLPGSRSGSRQSSAAGAARTSPPKGKAQDERGPWQGDIPEWDQNLAYERRVFTRGEEDESNRWQGDMPQGQGSPQGQGQQGQYQQQTSPQSQQQQHYQQQQYEQQQQQFYQQQHAQQLAQQQYYQQQQYQQAQQQQQGGYQQQEYNHYQQAGQPQQSHFQQNEDYQTLPQVEYDDQEGFGWDKGDAPAVGDLTDPPSPMRSPGGGRRSGGPGPRAGYEGSPASPSSPNPPHSPRNFRRDVASDATAQPTVLTFGEGDGGGQQSPSPRKDDKVKLWLPDAMPPADPDERPIGGTGGGYRDPDERPIGGMGGGGGGGGGGGAAQVDEQAPTGTGYSAVDERMPTGGGYKPAAVDERMPTGVGYTEAERPIGGTGGGRGGGGGSAPAEDVPWWEKAEQAGIVGSPQGRRRRAVEERSEVGSAPVSAPSSASSSRSNIYDDKLGLLQQATPTRSRRDLSSASSSASSRQGSAPGSAPRHGRREGSANRPRPVSILKRTPPVTSSAADSADDYADEPPSPTRRQMNKSQMSKSGKSAIDIGSRPVELMSTDDLTPMEDPQKAARLCANKLNSDDWSAMYEGIDIVRRLAKHNPEAISGMSAELGASMLHLAQNLRSQVSRNALLGLYDMYTFLKKQMDSTIDTAVPALIKRACETNAFICEASDNALNAMVCNAGPRPIMVALLNVGSSRQAQQRTKAAVHLEALIDKQGDKLLQCRETDRLFPGLAAFTQDSNPECRAHGKRGLYRLSRLYNAAEFERKCTALISPEANCRKAQEVAAQGRAQGVEAFGVTAGGFGPGRGNVTGKRGQVGRLTVSAGAYTGKSNSLSNAKGHPSATAATGGAEDSLQALSVHGDGRDKGRSPRRVAPRRAVSTATRVTKDIPELEGMDQRYASMSAGDWRVRHSAVSELADLVLKFPAECRPRLQAIFDHLTLRLADGNSKVLLLALSSLERMVPVLRDDLEVVLNTLIPALSQQIGSANATVRQTTMQVLDQLIEHVDNTSLIQYFANVIAFGNPRAKAVIVEKTAVIVPRVYKQKPQLIMKHVLPRAVRLVEDPDASMRAACTLLLQALHDELGEKLEQTDMTDEQRRRVVAATQGDAQGQYHRSPAR